MDNWFSVDKVDSNTYAISEYGHWEETHSYLFIGKNKAILFDTGLGVGNIKQVVEKLTILPITVVTSHNHWDHIGGHSLFEDIAIHEGDRKWMEEGLPIPLEVVKDNFRSQPFKKQPPPDFNIDSYQVFTGKPTRILHDGDKLDLGGRILEIIHTPGHSPGHICLYEPSSGYLATGDLIYKGTIFCHYPSTDPQQLAKSIIKISKLPGVARLLPAHHDLTISTNLLGEARLFVEEITRKGLLKHGSGLHKSQNINIRF